MQAVGVLAHQPRRRATLECREELVVLSLPKRVEIVSERAGEEDGVLRDRREREAEGAPGHAARVDAAEHDRPTLEADGAEEAREDRGLARSGAPTDAHVLAIRDGEREPVQHQRQPRAVAHLHVVEDDLTRRCLLYTSPSPRDS